MKAFRAELFTAVPSERDQERNKEEVAPCKHSTIPVTPENRAAAGKCTGSADGNIF